MGHIKYAIIWVTPDESVHTEPISLNHGKALAGFQIKKNQFTESAFYGLKSLAH